MKKGASPPLRWAILYGLVVTLLFAAWFVVLKPVTFVSPQECYTGAIAKDVLGEGLRFPLLRYLPYAYEPGILIQGLLNVPLFGLLGENVLVLKLVPLALSAIAATACLWLLYRLLDEDAKTSAGEKVVATSVFLAVIAFASRMFAMTGTQAVGDHAAGTMLCYVLLVLLVRRRESSAPLRIGALWIFAGVSVVWQKGALSVVGLGALVEVVLLIRKKSTLRLAALSFGCFALSAFPAVLLSAEVGFSDFKEVFSKFGQGERLPFLPDALGYVQDSALVAAALGVSLLYVGFRCVSRREREAAPLLTAYLGLVLILLWSRSDHSSSRYFCYALPGLAVTMTVMVMDGLKLLTKSRPFSLPGARLAGGVFTPIVITAALGPAIQVEPSRPKELWHNTHEAACSWRFGRAFWTHSGRMNEATGLSHGVHRCRVFKPKEALECLAGLASDTSHADPSLARMSDLDLREDERLAWAFGVGRGIVFDGKGGPDRCTLLSDAGEHAQCDSGRLFECLTMADLVQGAVLGGSSLPRPPCTFPKPAIGGYFTAGWRKFAGRPLPSPPAVESATLAFLQPYCREVIATCYGTEP